MILVYQSNTIIPSIISQSYRVMKAGEMVEMVEMTGERSLVKLQTIREVIGMKYKRLLPFTINEAASTFLTELHQDAETEAKLYIHTTQRLIGKDTIFKIGDNEQFNQDNAEVKWMHYSQWRAYVI